MIAVYMLRKVKCGLNSDANLPWKTHKFESRFILHFTFLTNLLLLQYAIFKTNSNRNNTVGKLKEMNIAVHRETSNGRNLKFSVPSPLAFLLTYHYKQ